ncbi:MAG: FAD-dependent oxidoreductase [Roseomonas sp.]|nr:FAD-dependent oxidoreductase [Roseomonas sp.]MCA3321430.1 FAD-dependent oxidoreductase [Roseomonas sp.]
MNAAEPFARFAYRPHADQARATPAEYPVVIVGAGPVGLTLAIDLKLRGVECVLIDDQDRIGEGSRAICFAKRTLEIWDRLGCAAPMLEKGVRWNIGKVFQGEDLLYQFDLLPEPGHKLPAFINLQQYYAEKFLVNRAQTLGVDLRWLNRVSGVQTGDQGARLRIETPDGAYSLDARFVVACDGARSPTRSLLGLDFMGEAFEDQFLIADVRMTAAFPVERWFWFDPPFHSGQSCLLHKQPDDIWRIDLQLSPDADAEYERRPDVVRPRIERMLGHRDFELEWISVYRFQCRRLESFVHGSIIFAGDAAHQVSPFGARGANSGVQDADNLGWKLAAVLQGKAGLIESYNQERSEAADENILNSTRATDFIAPRQKAEARFRNAALALARQTEFGKRFVNSGRLSTPTAYHDSPLSTLDDVAWAAGPRPGAPIPDAPLGKGYLSERLEHGFALLCRPDAKETTAIARLPLIEATEGDETLIQRFDLAPGSAYLIRPDRHVAARFRSPEHTIALTALRRAGGA